MTERQQVQEPQRMHQALIFQIPAHFPLQRRNVRQNISVRDHHSPGLRRSARGENNLQDVVAPQRDTGQLVRGLIQHSPQILQAQTWNRQSVRRALMQVPPRPHQQFRRDLLKDSHGKIGRGSVIHGHNNHSAESAPEEHRRPLGAVFAPNHHAVAFCYPPRLQFAGEAPGHLQDFAVGKRFRAISAPLPVGALVTMCPKILQEEFCNRFGHGIHANVRIIVFCRRHPERSRFSGGVKDLARRPSESLPQV